MARRRRKRPIKGKGNRWNREESSLWLHVNRREWATILAALRFHADENLQGTSQIPDRRIHQIATGGGAFRALGFEEVTGLCRRLKVVDQGSKGTCIRPWQCPRCGQGITCSYEDLAEAGTPLCTRCDTEMELQ